MILDALANAGLYAFSNPRLVRGFEFLRSRDLTTVPVGRVEIDSDLLFASVQEYPTRLPDQCFWEAHRKYIDIQYVIRGTERIGYAPLASLRVAQPYDEAKDFAKLDGTGDVLRVDAGMFAVFFPHDAHMPCMAADAPAPVRKVVVKVAV
jgi:YhcH/YjgK/YiaL family protein